MINEEESVTWIRSYVSEDSKKCFCAYDAPSPEAMTNLNEAVFTGLEAVNVSYIRLPLST